MDGATCNCCCLGARSVYTIQPCSMPRRLMQNHICRVHACLAVTCHRHFWQNDRDLLHAIAVPRWWNGYRNNNNSQHRKLTPEKKLLPLFLPDSNPQYFDHESGALTTELPPPPPHPVYAGVYSQYISLFYLRLQHTVAMFQIRTDFRRRVLRAMAFRLSPALSIPVDRSRDPGLHLWSLQTDQAISDQERCQQYDSTCHQR